MEKISIDDDHRTRCYQFYPFISRMKSNMMKIILIRLIIILSYDLSSSHAWLNSITCDDSPFVPRNENWQGWRSRAYPPGPTSRKFSVSVVGMISEQQLGTFETIETEESPSERKVALLDYTTETIPSLSPSPLLIDLETAWGYQRQILDEQLQRLTEADRERKNGNDGWRSSSFLPTMEEDDQTENFGHRDTIIILQHHPVYTLGTGSDEKFVKSLSSSDNGTKNSNENSYPTVPVIRINRGGEVTYHGPGQLTVYPVLDLRSYRQDIHWYMRALEEAIILAISKCSTGTKILRAEREDGVTGVWIDNHKVAAIGIKCRRWITQHGLAVNVEESSLSNFEGIVPCGLEGRKVGCLNQFLLEQGDDPITVGDFAVFMKEALEEIFRIELVNQPLLLQ